MIGLNKKQNQQKKKKKQERNQMSLSASPPQFSSVLSLFVN